MAGKKVTIAERNGVRFYSIRGCFGTKFAEERAREINLPHQKKELWFDHTFLIPQYRVLELILGYCAPRNCSKCNIGSGKGGNFINPECLENFFKLVS